MAKQEKSKIGLTIFVAIEFEGYIMGEDLVKIFWYLERIWSQDSELSLSLSLSLTHTQIYISPLSKLI